MLKVLGLSLYSRRMLQQVQEREGLDFDYRRKGKLHLYFDESTLAAAKPLIKLKNRLGCRQRILSAQHCVNREPALRHAARGIVGGVFSPLDESGDTYALTRGLADACTANGPVRFSFGCTVRSIQRRNGDITGVLTKRGVVDADAYVICAGASSARLCHSLGLRLPIQPAKGYSITLPAGTSPPRVSITDTRAKTVYSLLADRLRIAGLLEFAGFDHNKDNTRIYRLFHTARGDFPQAADFEGELQTWCGLRPLTPDSAPIIGATPYMNLYLNTGHGMLGSTLACGSAVLIADIVEGRRPGVDPIGFALERFAGEGY
jgi:D-amino-acid dehydrogenase